MFKLPKNNSTRDSFQDLYDVFHPSKTEDLVFNKLTPEEVKDQNPELKGPSLLHQELQAHKRRSGFWGRMTNPSNSKDPMFDMDKLHKEVGNPTYPKIINRRK